MSTQLEDLQSLVTMAGSFNNKELKGIYEAVGQAIAASGADQMADAVTRLGDKADKYIPGSRESVKYERELMQFQHEQRMLQLEERRREAEVQQLEAQAQAAINHLNTP